MRFISNRDQVFSVLSSTPQTAAEIKEKVPEIHEVYRYLNILCREGKVEKRRSDLMYFPYVYSKV